MGALFYGLEQLTDEEENETKEPWKKCQTAESALYIKPSNSSPCRYWDPHSNTGGRRLLWEQMC